MRSIFVFLLLFLNQFSYSSFGPETLVYTPGGFISIHNLRSGQAIVSYDEQAQSFVQGTIQSSHSSKVTHIYKIICDDGSSFITTIDQRLMLYESHTWRMVKDLAIGDRLLCYENSFVTVSAIELLVDKILLSNVTVTPHHTFCVTLRGIVVHNHPVAIFAVAPIVSALSKVAIVGVISGALWKLLAGPRRSFEEAKTGKKKIGYTSQCIQDSSSTGCSSPPPPKKPRNEDEYNNMYEVFEKAPIGKKLKKVTQRTDFYRNDSRIYKVIEDVKEWGIKKGDWLYLDRMHGDHIEVFKKCGKIMRTILNMDGTQNLRKLAQAGIRSIEKYIK